MLVDKVLEAGFPLLIQAVSIDLPRNVRSDSEWVVTSSHSLCSTTGCSWPRTAYTVIVSTTNSWVKMPPFNDLAALEQRYASIVPITLQLTSDTGCTGLVRTLGVPLLNNLPLLP